MENQLEIKKMLDDLAGLRAARDAAQAEHERARAALVPAIPAEIAQAIADMDAEHEQRVSAAFAKIAALEESIRRSVVAHGATVRGDSGMMASYVRGRVSYDAKALDKYAAQNPIVLSFRTEGEPSVRISK